MKLRVVIVDDEPVDHRHRCSEDEQDQNISKGIFHLV